MNGAWPLSRSAINVSGSETRSITSARRKRSMCAGLPRLAGDQVLGNDTRFGRLVRCQVGVGKLLLRLVHRLLEAAVDADFHELEQRRNLARNTRDELLQARCRLLECRGGHRAINRRLEACERRLGARLDKRPTQLGDSRPVATGRPS